MRLPALLSIGTLIVLVSLTGVSALAQPALKPVVEEEAKPAPETTAKPIEKEMEEEADVNVLELGKKRKPAPEPGRRGLGIRLGIMPVNSLNYTESGGAQRAADMDMAFGFGAEAEYRWLSWLHLVGEVMFWSTRIEEYGTEAATLTPKDSDLLLNIGAGAKFGFYRNRSAKFDVYARVLLGLTHYFGDEDNRDVLSKDRTGISFGGGVGVERRLFRSFKVFADTGLYWNKFIFVPYEEDEASIFTWQVNMGLLFNFD